ncbi:MAG: VOC family protein [Acidobacteria bacterium]|nr:VOC family protein [Acidobacteriota bacterium]
MIRIREIDHVVLRVRDLDRMLWFYRDLLGCPIVKRQDAIGLVQLRAGRSLIDLSTSEGPSGWNMDHFCVRVEPFDAESIVAYLASHGIDAGKVVSRHGAEGDGPSLYVSDPEGNVVELKGAPW